MKSFTLSKEPHAKTTVRFSSHATVLSYSQFIKDKRDTVVLMNDEIEALLKLIKQNKPELLKTLDQ